MKNFILITLAIFLASCSKSGIEVIVDNQSEQEISNIACFTVLEGDTILSVKSLEAGGKSSVMLERGEGEVNYNLIFNFQRKGKLTETNIATLSVNKDISSAEIRFNITEKGSTVEYSTAD